MKANAASVKAQVEAIYPDAYANASTFHTPYGSVDLENFREESPGDTL